MIGPSRFQGPLTVVDLFSGAGGMSCGFARRRGFSVVGAVDIEHGKPSTGAGATQCNGTYAANIGIAPLAADMATLAPADLRFWRSCPSMRWKFGVELERPSVRRPEVELL